MGIDVGEYHSYIYDMCSMNNYCKLIYKKNANSLTNKKCSLRVEACKNIFLFHCLIKQPTKVKAV